MLTLQNARARVGAVLDEIDRLEQSEFPYDFPLDALSMLKERFLWHQRVLNKTSTNSSADLLRNVCRESLRDIRGYVAVLGFLLRATNVRNSFESHGALQRLAECLMGKDTRFIISSEWDFSPFVYRPLAELPGFVLIGLPAPESANPLLLPLAGHELGHSVWEYFRIVAVFADKVYQGAISEIVDNRWTEYNKLFPQYDKKDIRRKDLLVPPYVRLVHQWSLLQIEEMFCDFFGLRTFDESFLNAFAYLLSPGSSGQRSVAYPNIKRRVKHLIQASTKLQIPVPTGYDSVFIDEIEPSDPMTALLVSTADAVSSSLVDELIDMASRIADEKDVPKKKPGSVEATCKLYREWVVPVRERTSLIDIINAGWGCYMDEHLWEDVPQIKGKKDEDFIKNRERVLRDLMLKSLEISEIYDRLESTS